MPELIVGLDELERKFKALGYTVQVATLRKALRAAGTAIRDEASRLAPKDTGALSQNMTMRLKDVDINSGQIDIGPSKDEFYGLFQELGTAFLSPQPFLNPAFESKREEAINAMKEKLRTEIERVA